MTLTRRQKKFLHAGIAAGVAFTVGALSALQKVDFAALTSRRAIYLAALSLLGGGIVKLAGFLIEAIKTRDPIGRETP